MIETWRRLRAEWTASFATLGGTALSLILIGAGLVYISIGIFVQSIPIKAGAAAYAVLP